MTSKPPRPENLQELAEMIHELNAKWWTDLTTGKRIERNPHELLALVISELAEALEGERKDLMDDHLPHRKMAEVEMADAYIRLLDYAGGFKKQIIRADTSWRVPENKGEAIYWIMRSISADWDLSRPLLKIEAYCAKHQYDLFGAIQEKLEYNKTRADHTHEARLKANGKKF